MLVNTEKLSLTFILRFTCLWHDSLNLKGSCYKLSGSIRKRGGRGSPTCENPSTDWIRILCFSTCGGVRGRRTQQIELMVDVNLLLLTFEIAFSHLRSFQLMVKAEGKDLIADLS